MSSGKRGKQYELDLCTAVYETSGGDLIPEPVGYSGNHGLPAPDIHIDDGGKIHAIELKRTSKDRISIFHDRDDQQKDDLHQLITYCNQHPRLVVPYVGVRFDNRKLVLFNLWLKAPIRDMVVRSGENIAPVDCVNYTHSGNLSVQKPSLDEWDSATASDDAVEVLETIGYR